MKWKKQQVIPFKNNLEITQKYKNTKKEIRQ